MLLAPNNAEHYDHDVCSGLKTADWKVEAGGLEMSADTHRVKANGVNILLTPTEFRLLHFLMSHPELVHGRTILLDKAWKRKTSSGKRTVDVHIRNLRAALEPFGMDGLIQTVHGRGYRFSCN